MKTPSLVMVLSLQQGSSARDRGRRPQRFSPGGPRPLPANRAYDTYDCGTTFPPLALPRSVGRIARGGAIPATVGHGAVGLWAFSGALAAGRQKMDIVGCFVIAFCAGMGGATLRDVLLDRPVFWIVDGAYIVTVAAVSLLTFFVCPYIEPVLRSSELGSEVVGVGTGEEGDCDDQASATVGTNSGGGSGTSADDVGGDKVRGGGGNGNPRNKRILRAVLETPDALGMSLYSVYGAYVALHDCPQPTGPIPAIWLGLVGSCFGSFFVDLLCHVPPKILNARRHSLYMTPAILASSCYAAWDRFAPPDTQTLGAAIAVALAFSLRMCAFVHDLKLPHWEGGVVGE